MAGLLDKAKEFVSEKVANVPKPEATIDNVDLQGISCDGITYAAKVSVDNPYSHSIPICEISYSLKSADREIASGTIPDPGSLKGKDKTVMDVPVKVAHSVLMSLARDIGADWDIDYQIDLGFAIDLPIVGSYTIPLSRKGEIKLPSLRDCWNFMQRMKDGAGSGAAAEGGRDGGGGGGWVAKVMKRLKKSAAEKAKSLPKPEVKSIAAEVVGFAGDCLILKAKVSVYNPYCCSIPTPTTTYTLICCGSVVFTDTMKDQKSLEAKTETPLEAPVKVPFSSIVGLVKDIAGDWDIDYQLDMVLTFNIALVGAYKIPVTIKGELKLPKLSDIGTMFAKSLFG